MRLLLCADAGRPVWPPQSDQVPGSTVVALVALALGIGANATVFTLTNAILFKGFPFDDSDRIVYLRCRTSRRTASRACRFRISATGAKSVQSLDGIAAFTGCRQTNVADDNSLAEVYPTASMTSNAFRLIGQKPIVGRDFAPEDEVPGAPAGGDAHVWTLATALRQGSQCHRPHSPHERRIDEIIGVMPADFTVSLPTSDLWLPLAPTPQFELRQPRNFGAFGRLKDGQTVASVRGRVGLALAQFGARVSGDEQGFRGRGPLLQGARDRSAHHHDVLCDDGGCQFRPADRVRQRGQSAARPGDQTFARNLDPRRARCEPQGRHSAVLVENVALGRWWSAWRADCRLGATAFDLAIIPMGKPRWIRPRHGHEVAGLSGGVSVGTGVLFGLAPALRLSKLDVNTSLKDGGRGSSGGLRRDVSSNVSYSPRWRSPSCCWPVPV